MNKLYLITGPAGVGKSTVAKKLAESLEKSVLISGDEIYNTVVSGYVLPWLEGNHLDLFWKNCTNLINNSLSFGYDVIFDYIILKDKISDIKKEFINYDVKFVVLIANEEVLLERDKLRPLDWQMGNRVVELLDEFKKQRFDKQNILDVSSLSIQECIDEIKNKNKYTIS